MPSRPLAPAAPTAAASALAWSVLAGADTLVDAAPRNWLAAPARPAALPAWTPARAARAASAPAPEAAAPAADPTRIADLAGVAAALADLPHPLRRAGLAPQLVTGPGAAPLLLLGDWPEPAGSPADRLLARMLAAIDLDPAACAFAHLVPWPTPGGRPLRDDEIAAFAPWLAHGLTLAAPRCILALGDRAAALTGANRGAAALRGGLFAIAGIPTLVSLHPRRLLDQPELKRLAWADLQALAARITA